MVWVVGLVVLVFGVGCFGSGPVERGCRACVIDFFAFHLTAARVFVSLGFSLACIDAGFVFVCTPESNPAANDR